MWTSQSLAEALVSQGPESVIAVGLDHRVVTWSPGAERLYGFRADEAVGKVVYELVARHLSHATFEAFLQRTIAVGRQVLADRRTRKDGTPLETEATFVPLFDAERRPAGIVGITRDVTELMAARRRAALGVAEPSRDAGSAAPDFVVRADGSILEMNDRALALYGYAREEVARLHVRDLRPPGDDPTFQQRLKAALESGFAFETIHRRKDGSLFPVEVRSHRVMVDGAPLLHTSVTDLSVQVEVVREGQALAYLMKHLRDAVIQWDPGNRVVEWTGAAEQLLGWTRAEALGKKIGVDLEREYPLGDGARVAAAVASGQPVETRVRMRRKDGGWANLDVLAGPLRDEHGHRTGLLAVGRDLTAQLRAEAERDESQAQLRSVVASMSDGLLLLNTEGRVLMSNAAAARILGVAQSDLEGHVKPASGWVTRDEQGRPILPAAHPVSEALRSRTPLHGQVFEVASPHQAPRWLSFNVAPLIRPGETAPWAAVATFSDITDQRTLAQERQALADRRHESEKLDSLRAMAAGVAHHFNNKLTVVIGNLELLSLSVRPDDVPLVQDAERSARDAAGISGQLLNYLGQGFTQAAPHRLRADLSRLLELQQVRLPAGVRLELAAGTDDPPVRIEQRELRRVLSSLVTNATEAVQRRGGLVQVSWTLSSTPPADVPAGSARVTSWAVLTVADDGEGLSDEARKHLFEPFFSTRFPGRGLGLPVSWGIVRGLGGSITIDSQSGKGTTVRVWLPVEPLEPPKSTTVSAEVPNGGGLLLVDDDPLVLATSVRLLQRSRRELHVATSGSAAVEQLRRHRAGIGLALVDFHMPGLGGWPLLRALREAAPELKLVVITGSDVAALEARQTEERLTPDAWLQKPYGSQELDALLKRFFPG